MTTKPTRSEKIQNLRDLRSMADYIKDMNEIIITGHKQPNGQAYLHGEPISWSRYCKAVDEYNELVAFRNAYTNDHLPRLSVSTFLKLSSKSIQGKVVRGNYNQIEFACSLTLFPDLWKLIMGKKYWTAYMADLRYSNTIN